MNGTAKPHLDSTGSLLGLAKDIAEKTQQINDVLETNGHAALSFEPNTGEPPNDPDYESIRSSLKTSLEDLLRLIDGPRRHMRAFLLEGYDLAAFQVALDFRFFDHVPAEGEISYHELAQLANLDVDRVSRLVRMMITHRFFTECTPGSVSHNNASLILKRDTEFRATVHYTLDEMWKAATATSGFLKQSPHVSNSEHTAFEMRHGLPIFKFYEQNPKLAARFAQAMAGATRMDRHLNELRDCFPWAKLNGKVVDCGGGSGHVSMALAKLFPSLEFVVQDGSSNMLAEGKAILERDPTTRDRVTFMQHSFFEPQPVHDAGCYLIRQCTHNWCDADVVTMFRSIVRGLENSKPGTPFLINDIIMPQAGSIPRHLERELRQIDMIMLIAFGAKQRTRAEFQALLEEADPRYVIKSVQGEGEPLGLLEVHLQGAT